MMRTALAVVLLSAACGGEEVTFGMGCFFAGSTKLQDSGLRLRKVEIGYAGGFMKDPDFKAVMRGKTGHAQVINVDFNPEETSLKEILAFFWANHDPTHAHGQAGSIGSQYRSIALFRTPEQNQTIHATLHGYLSDADVDSSAITTEIAALDHFWAAESNVREMAPKVESEIKQEMQAYLTQEKEKAMARYHTEAEASSRGLAEEVRQREMDILEALRAEDTAKVDELKHKPLKGEDDDDDRDKRQDYSDEEARNRIRDDTVANLRFADRVQD